jgi:L-asparagine transporter-like permease
MAAHDHAGHDHAAELLAAGASQGAHGGHDHGLPPGVVALEGAELVAACALAAAEDPRGALDLRVAAIFIIAIGSALGVFLPLLLQRWRAFDKNRAPFFVLKAFGAGVILATGVVHMYPAASSALASPCLGWPEFPW